MKGAARTLQLVLIASCAAPVPRGGGTEGGAAVNRAGGQSPWDLRLEQSGPLELRLLLRNTSGQPQTFLHHAELQPSVLRIRSASGASIEPSDTRARAKFDVTVYRGYYRTLDPGADAILGQATFQLDPADGYYVFWDPFQFHGMAPGTYRIFATWTSAKDRWEEPDEHASGTIAGIWKGEAASNTIEVRLP